MDPFEIATLVLITGLWIMADYNFAKAGSPMWFRVLCFALNLFLWLALFNESVYGQEPVPAPPIQANVYRIVVRYPILHEAFPGTNHWAFHEKETATWNKIHGIWYVDGEMSNETLAEFLLLKASKVRAGNITNKSVLTQLANKVRTARIDIADVLKNPSDGTLSSDVWDAQPTAKIIVGKFQYKYLVTEVDVPYHDFADIGFEVHPINTEALVKSPFRRTNPPFPDE
jgi:hypothetical protein